VRVLASVGAIAVLAMMVSLLLASTKRQ
jgi:hypothetical protein